MVEIDGRRYHPWLRHLPGDNEPYYIIIAHKKLPGELVGSPGSFSNCVSYRATAGMIVGEVHRGLPLWVWQRTPERTGPRNYHRGLSLQRFDDLATVTTIFAVTHSVGLRRDRCARLAAQAELSSGARS